VHRRDLSHHGRTLTQAAAELCGGKLVLVHEGGYSEPYVPFCGHGVIEVLAGSDIHVPDPFAETFRARQPDSRFNGFVRTLLDEQVAAAGLA